MARFKAITMGKPILMGRKTWESFPKKPLPGRKNIVLTRDANFRADGAWTFSDLPAALAAARAMAATDGADEICGIGGAALYAQTLAFMDRVYLTEVDAAPEGDAHFSAFDEGAFREMGRDVVAPGPKDEYGYVARVLDRK
jgi:dihydrofolate reductase